MPSRSPKRAAPSAEIKLPAMNEFRLGNGLSVTSVRRGQLPLVALTFFARCGSSQDPPTRHGLAEFSARLLKRGTRSKTADQINDEVEFVGAALGTGCGEDYLVARMTVPSEHLVPMVHLLADILREPRFLEEEVESAKARELGRLANDLDDPALLADRAIVRAVWGAHPYGHDVGGSASHVQAFTRDDVVRFHRACFGPQVSSIVTVGHFDENAFVQAVEEAFGSWTGGPPAAPTLPTPTQIAHLGKVILINKPDQTQTQVRIGGLAIARNHSEFMAAHVANTALGGGFTSRLMDQIRVNRGLSYGVHSAIDAMKAAGWFGISTFTKTDSTQEIIEVALEETKKLRERGLKAKELLQTQTYLAGLYPLRTESNEALASSLADIQLYGLGKDWIERFRQRVFQVSLPETRQAASRYFLADGQVIVLVGNARALQSHASSFGTVESWEMDALH